MLGRQLVIAYLLIIFRYFLSFLIKTVFLDFFTRIMGNLVLKKAVFLFYKPLPVCVLFKESKALKKEVSFFLVCLYQC